MKRLFLPFLLAFFGFSGILLAQPTLTAANSGFRIGDEFLLRSYGTSHNVYLHPQSGANQLWDYSLFSSNVSDTIKVLAPSQAPHGVLVQGVDLVVYSRNHYLNNYANYANFRYLSVHNSGVAAYGSFFEALPNQNPVIYNRAVTMLPYPFSFNSNVTDTLAYNLFGANGTLCTAKRLITVEAIGYGKLITPASSYKEALLVKTTAEALSNGLCSGGLHQIVSYDWYVAGTHIPVMQLTSNYAALNSAYKGYYLQNNTLGSKENLASQLNLQTFPNPATSEVTIQAKFISSSEVKLVVTDALGKVVLQKQDKMQADGSFIHKLDVRNLPKGVYLVRLETADHVAVRKLLVQ